MAELTRKEVIIALAGMQASAGKNGAQRGRLAGVDLSELDLRSLDLSFVNFWRANLRGCDLRGCDLRGAMFAEANMQECDLRSALMESIGDSDELCFHGTDLSGADLSGSAIVGAEMEDANLDGALLDGIKLRDVQAAGADFTGTVLKGATLENVILSRGALDAADASVVDLSGVVWWEATTTGKKRQGRPVSMTPRHGGAAAGDTAGPGDGPCWVWQAVTELGEIMAGYLVTEAGDINRPIAFVDCSGGPGAIEQADGLKLAQQIARNPGLAAARNCIALSHGPLPGFIYGLECMRLDDAGEPVDDAVLMVTRPQTTGVQPVAKAS